MVTDPELTLGGDLIKVGPGDQLSEPHPRQQVALHASYQSPQNLMLDSTRLSKVCCPAREAGRDVLPILY